MNRKALKRIRPFVHTNPITETMADVIDALLADDAPSEPPADVRPPGALDARDGFGMSAAPAGRIVCVVLARDGHVVQASESHSQMLRVYSLKIRDGEVRLVRARLEEEP